MIRLLILSIIKFILGAEAGASFSWSAKWQDKKPWYSEIPEALDALILAFMATTTIWMNLFPLDRVLTIGYDAYHLGLSIGVLVFIASSAIAYAGIQSATWMFLRWYSHSDPNTTRESSTKPVVDWVAEKFGWKLGDEGYAWTASTVKGSVICFPAALILAPIGGLMFAFGYEIGSWFKRKGRDKYLPKWMKPHAVAEGMSFVNVGIFYFVCGVLASHIGALIT